jgi:hypothetical protein
LIRREPVFHRYGVFKVRAGRRPLSTTTHAVRQHRAVSQNSTVSSTARSTLFQASRRTGRRLESPHRRVRRLPE